MPRRTKTTEEAPRRRKPAKKEPKGGNLSAPLTGQLKGLSPAAALSLLRRSWRGR